ncbi:hypothetical protein BsWGS_05995 [Bradybaena similaris]
MLKVNSSPSRTREVPTSPISGKALLSEGYSTRHRKLFARHSCSYFSKEVTLHSPSRLGIVASLPVGPQFITIVTFQITLSPCYEKCGTRCYEQMS